MSSPDVAELVWAWAENLPPWQSDLLRRLCEVDTLDDEEREVVGRMLLAEHGALPEGLEVTTPEPLTRTHLPQAKAGPKVKLQRLEDVSGLGAVATGHVLRFDEGLTIVYGANGAGKSSYAKLLKNACRPRHAAAERVLGNVYDDEDVQGAATFVMVDAGEERSVTRAHEAPPEAALRSVRIFDEGAVEAYMGKVGAPPDLVPAPLQLLTRFARELTALRAWCDEQERLRQRDEPRLSPTAAALLQPYAARNTPLESVLLGLALDAAEEARWRLLDDLLGATTEAEVEERRRAALRRRSDLERLWHALSEMESAVSDEAVEHVQAARDDAAHTERAVTAMSQAAVEWDLAPDTGGSDWRALWSAASAFHAHGESGAIEEALRCPLCRAPVADDTRARLRFLAALVYGEAEQERQRAASRLAALTTALDVTALDEGVFEKLGSTSPAVGEAPDDPLTRARAFVRACAARALALRSGEPLPPLPPSPAAEVEALLRDAERAHDIAARRHSAKERTALEREHAALSARRELLRDPDAVQALLTSARRAKAIAKAKRAAASNTVTKHQGTLAEAVITKPLADAFKAEKEALDLRHLPLDLDPSTRAATTTTEVVLREAKRQAKVKEVLSCGERRAAALAFFLAEARVSDDGPIVLDDPVSSLDQDRIDHVARRLIDEASRRQVIVFTHDIGLKNMLEDLADARKLSHGTVVVIRHGLMAGILTDTTTWIGGNTKDRRKYLAARLEDMERLEAGHDHDTFRWHCVAFLTHLRSAWERAVETEMLHKAVERFNRAIRPGSLQHVRVTRDLVEAVQLNMERCARALHDQHHRSGIRIPTTAELKALLEDFDAFVQGCQALKTAAKNKEC